MIRFDRIQRAVVGMVSYLADAEPLVLWAPSHFPRRSDGVSVVTARAVRGPLVRPASVMSSNEPTILTWVIAAPAEGDRVGVSITGAQWTVDVPAMGTAETVRDALLELFTPEILPGVTVSDSGTDTIVFDADDVPGLLWRPQGIGPGVTVTATEVVPCEIATATAEVVVELQAYASGRGLSALSILADVAGGVHLEGAIERRNTTGVSLINVSELIDLTSIAGADWESRASMRMTLGVRSYKARTIDIIDTVELTADVDNVSVTVLVEA